MKSNIHIKDLTEFSFISNKLVGMRTKVNCIMIHHKDAVNQFSTDVHMDGFIAILVLSGTGTAYINYKSYPVKEDSLLLLSSSHLFHFHHCTADFRCRCLLVGKDFMDTMDSTDMISQRARYGVRVYNTPVIQLTRANTQLLLNRIDTVNQVLDNTGHFYYKEMIVNTLFTFYLDLSNIIERYTAGHNEGYVTRHETIIESFIELLSAHYREEHHVEFYASQLNISAHYLTQIVKSVTGQTVNDFIFEMLYSEARTLLAHSRQSVQEIATVLNFSDQSSFGKFFKRKSGISPLDFRKKWNYKVT